MKLSSVTILMVVLSATNAYADLKPDIIDCNAKKVARNAAMDATVGVSGGCDSSKLVKDSKDDAVDKVKDTVGVDGHGDKGLKNLGEGKNHNKGLLKKNKD